MEKLGDAMDRNTRLSSHFTLEEMIRSQTADRKGIDNTPPENLISHLIFLCDQILEPVRLHFDRPFRPNSGYRSPQLNAAIGGAPQSQHCKGEAVDIEIAGVSNYDLAVWCRDHLVYDQIILECYRPGVPNSGWVHISLKRDKDKNRMNTLYYCDRQYHQGLIA